MEKYINEHNKECWKGVTESSKFTPDLFHYPEWQPKENGEYSLAFHSEMGSLTILKRWTGFGYIDIETGYRDKNDKFWLASGDRDVRESDCKTVGEAIEWVKKYANTCVGV